MGRVPGGPDVRASAGEGVYPEAGAASRGSRAAWGLETRLVELPLGFEELELIPGILQGGVGAIREGQRDGGAQEPQKERCFLEASKARCWHQQVAELEEGLCPERA